jgi:5-methylcytosine-specific restriction enzyme subunit McrC
MFLKHEWQATQNDASVQHGITLLFPMNKLFEAYIAALARRALRGSDLIVHTQGGLLNCLIEEGGGGERFQTKPDIIIIRGAVAVMVIDSKWKRIGRDAGDAKRGA